MLANWATVIDPEISISIVKRNDADNRILECAIAANADYIVTGDRRDLLPLKQFQGIKIVSSGQFISVLGI
jgi:predicted nucleic acid-binding protein